MGDTFRWALLFTTIFYPFVLLTILGFSYWAIGFRRVWAALKGLESTAVTRIVISRLGYAANGIGLAFAVAAWQEYAGLRWVFIPVSFALYAVSYYTTRKVRRLLKVT